MFNLWKTGTAIFLLQLVGFAISYDIFDKGNVEMAKVVEAIIAAGIALTAGLFIIVEARMDEKVGSPTIFLLAVAAAVIALPRGIIPADTIIVLVAGAFLLMAVMLERVENESILGCFFATIPGLGTIIGGAILLYRWYFRRRNISAM
jgi:hypothetical protein